MFSEDPPHFSKFALRTKEAKICNQREQCLVFLKRLFLQKSLALKNQVAFLGSKFVEDTTFNVNFQKEDFVPKDFQTTTSFS